jgi:peptide/nickel transport system permease protein
MSGYLFRRLLLLPLTIFCIILVNFVILNFAPGDPVSVTQIGEGGAARRESQAMAMGDQRYLQFREHYGLTLPVLFNTWPWLSQTYVYETLQTLLKEGDGQGMSVREFDALRVRFGDQSRFVMPHLLRIIQDRALPFDLRKLAIRFFVRGGTRQAIVNPHATLEEKRYNTQVAQNNLFLLQQIPETQEEMESKVRALTEWYNAQKERSRFEPTSMQKVYMFFFETRFFRYMSRVLTLDFGYLRNDPNKSVISEVTKRFKYSLTLSVIPMILTVILCQIFGFLMAYHQHRWPDLSLNLLFLILYAIPVFVVAPFLIEKVALNRTFPFTHQEIPISGFTSPEDVYSQLTSAGRFWDTVKHLILPITAVMYGGLAAHTRLSRTAVLEVLRQDYVRTAKAKGLSSWQILTKHVGRNAGITIVTSVAGSLGLVLGGSLIVETLFDINGFGKFFYDAVINRDYNVIMFSAIASAILALIGYLIADLLYMWLDPRVTLE